VNRCTWPTNELSLVYHDTEWGTPLHDDQRLFEFLILEGAQAGLSWDTILRKRENYRRVFDNFDVLKVAAYDDAKCASLLMDDGIIRNRLKIASAVANAKAFLKVQNEFGSFDEYIWKSDAISKDLKKRGFNFVGSTIMYAFMQATGMVNDHLTTCFRYEEVKV
jgi:DNA-3-methyladenine glycosylase I